jgi:flagellar basal-body rod modification protein FlgD
MAVMGLKTGTKSWSEAPQNEVTKSEKINLNSAHDLNKLGDENVGDLLNKMVDPNWVDPGKKVRAVGSDKMDKDAFMKLMLAQMKHQDPTNPMQSHELAAQLAQFSSVEQLQNVNKTLDEMRAGQKPSEGFQALNFIGKAVSGDSSKLARVKGDKTHDISFSLPDDAQETKVRVRNASGEVIRTVDLKSLKKGENNFTWNGLDERGVPAPAGDYQLFIEATNANGAKLAVKTEFDGVITGLSYGADGPVLMVGTQTIKLKDVKKIVDPSLMKNDQKINSSVLPDLKKQPGALDNSKKEEEVAGAGDPVPEPASNLMTSVGMSREMMDKLQKETRQTK